MPDFRPARNITVASGIEVEAAANRPAFIPGLELCRAFFQEVLRPILAAGFPRLGYSAALIGPGSEVLGFDTEMSTDHCWGPRALVFLSAEDVELQGPAVVRLLQERLPPEFRGYPTRFAGPGEDSP